MYYTEEMMSGGCEVDVGIPCQSTNLCKINDRVMFLLVKLNTVDLVNIWLSLECSIMKSSTLFEH